MRGWEVVAQASQHFSPSFATYAPIVFDQAVAAGIDRVRLEVRGGSENSADSWGEWAAAGFAGSGTAYTTWRAKRYETINDNADPNVISPGGFHFSALDDTIDLIVNPLRQRLAAKGEALYVNLNYVAFTFQITSGQPYIHNQPAEYAEFMLAAFQHLQSKYGFVPDAIEVILEPDNVSQWNGTIVGQAIVATGQKLAAAGFTPEFIAPSTTSMANAVSWTDAILAVQNVKTYLKEIAYHRYSGVSAANLQAIASRAQTHGLSTAMLDWWDMPTNNTETLHEDLRDGHNSAWQQATLAEFTQPTLGLLYVDPASPTNVSSGSLTRYTSQ